MKTREIGEKKKALAVKLNFRAFEIDSFNNACVV